MAQTQEEYYNPENLGGYQYLKLSEVVNDFVLQSHDSESHLSGLSRALLIRHAKAALKELHRSAAKDIKALELTIGDDLQFRLPQDYVDYVRVSVVRGDNTLATLDINHNLNVATTYLQDNDYNLLFDADGNVLESDGNNLSNIPYRSFQIDFNGYGGFQQTDTSKLSKNGEYVISQRDGVIFFGSNLQGKDVVLEYVSDGVEWERLKDTEITFHKHLLQALEELIYYKCIERRKNVPANEKYRARKQYLSARHQAKILMANFDIQAIARVWRKGAKWVKS